MALVKGKITAGEVLDYDDGVTDGADVIIGITVPTRFSQAAART